MKFVSVALGALCVCFLAVVAIGAFGAGPAGGPLPWSQSRQDGEPAAGEPSPSREDTGEPVEEEPAGVGGTEREPASEPSSGTPGPPVPRASSPAGPGGGTSEPPAATSAPSEASVVTDAPGNSGNAPRRSPDAEGKGPR